MLVQVELHRKVDISPVGCRLPVPLFADGGVLDVNHTMDLQLYADDVGVTEEFDGGVPQTAEYRGVGQGLRVAEQSLPGERRVEVTLWPRAPGDGRAGFVAWFLRRGGHIT